MVRLRILIPGLLVLFIPDVAQADSDGYFCVGAGYIAVEFRSFNTPGLAGKHVVRIARFDSRGPRWTGEVVIADFQTHTMACDAATVRIEGAGERGRGVQSYRIAVDSSGVPTVLRHTTNPDHRVDAVPQAPGNIGNWAPEGIRVLSGRPDSAHFRLRVARSTETHDHAIHHLITSRLEEVDASGRVLRELVINKGVRIETVN